MKISRRRFISSMSGMIGASVLPRLGRAVPNLSAEYFGVSPFIENNPNAVFIMETQVGSKFDADAKKQAGYQFGQSVFVPLTKEQGGFPVSQRVAIKPNLTERGKWQNGYTTELSMGVVTDVYFIEGLINSFVDLGMKGNQFYIREVNGAADIAEGGYIDMAQRIGMDAAVVSQKASSLGANQVVWSDVTDGVFFKKIPHLWPFNAPDTFTLNVAKLKSHGMGMTLCAKNLQGTIAASYQKHCTEYNREMDISVQHQHADAKQVISQNYQRHLNIGIPRWDRPGQYGGIWQETWASRCLDNNSALKPHLHIIEGIYGHDGNFIQGPHDGFAADFMTNLILFGKNPFYVDIIGNWIAGHEPGNFGLFHLAKERGFIQTFDPAGIPLYQWNAEGQVQLADYTKLQRTPLKTYYLQRDYNGQNEPYWHMVDEAYNYSSISSKDTAAYPERFQLQQNYPNPFNESTTICFTVPETAYVRLYIYNIHGEQVGRLVEGFIAPGFYHNTWNSQGLPSGHYFYKLTAGGFESVRRMVMVR
ncbi:DUF362 domain-containing protein [candidate division KSB1 bacterium]|nr:DUF362 domain-containing protein [candidate division KSB1 bacterium]